MVRALLSVLAPFVLTEGNLVLSISQYRKASADVAKRQCFMHQNLSQYFREKRPQKQPSKSLKSLKYLFIQAPLFRRQVNGGPRV